MNQKRVWDEISFLWTIYRNKPIREVVVFLSKQKGRILDLGCGSGRNFIKLDKKSTIYGVDFSDKQVEQARQKVLKNKIRAKVFKAKATKIPFQNNFFDSAVFIATLHCIPTKRKRQKAIAELFRVLKPGKQALISVWDKNHPKFRNAKKKIKMKWQVGDKEYKRFYYLYEEPELIELLKKIGFKIIKTFKSKRRDKYAHRNIMIIVRKPRARVKKKKFKLKFPNFRKKKK